MNNENEAHSPRTEPTVSKRSGRASAEMNIDGKTIVFYGETSDEARGKAKAYEIGYSNGFHQRVDSEARVDDSAYYDGWFAGECQRLRENETTVSPEHDPVHNPAHYTAHPSGVECIEIAEHMTYCLGNVVKYVWRAGLKSDTPIQDLEKARFYLSREIDRLRKSGPTP